MIAIPKTALDGWVKAKIGLSAHRELTGKALCAYHVEKLRQTLNYARSCSPFYRQRLAACKPGALHSVRDLAEWPLTTTEDIEKDPLAFLCVSQSQVERVVTLPARYPGGRRRRFFFSAADLELAVDFFYHGFSGYLVPGQRMLVLLPCTRPASVGDLICRALERLSVDAVAHGLIRSPEAALEAMLANSIDCLVGVASQLLDLSHHPAAVRIPKSQLQSIWLGMENASQQVVEEIARFYRCPVYQQVGADEICPGAGVQCGARHGFHLREADLFLEILDPCSGALAKDGALGEAVVTTLTRQAMPLVRYRTGLIVSNVSQPCPCGSHLRRLTTPPGSVTNGSA